MEFPQPTELTIDEPVNPVDQSCPRCSADTMYRYRLVDYRGWLEVVKCRSCLHVEDRRPIVAPPQGTP
ncbi:hypothetical protein ABZ639_08755 [Saccharomonospora sp. NPDC006951]